MAAICIEIELNDEKWVLILLFCYMLHNEQSAPHKIITKTDYNSIISQC